MVGGPHILACFVFGLRLIGGAGFAKIYLDFTFGAGKNLNDEHR